MTMFFVMAGLLHAYTANAETRPEPRDAEARSIKDYAYAHYERTIARKVTSSRAHAAAILSTAAVNIPALTPFQIDSLELRKYSYVDASYDYNILPPFTAAEFCNRAGTVIFTVNKTDIRPGDPFLRELRTEIAPLIKSQNLELYRIDVRGAASPEGSVQNNDRLARGRANILRDSITAILPSAKGDIIKLSSVTEDYELLVYLMEKAGDPDTEIVRGICEKWAKSPKDLKWALYTYNGRKLWNRLLRDYFPQLRATRVILYFHIAPDAEPEPGPKPPHECECKGKYECHCAEEGPECPCYEVTLDGRPCSCVVPPPPPHECECKGQYVCHCAEEGPECPCYPLTLDGSPCPCILVADTVSVEVHRRPVLAIGTNMLYDLWYMPDFGFAPMWNGRIEWYPYNEKRPFWNHTSFAAAFVNPYWHKWDEHKFYQIRNYELEGRWYSRFDEEWGQRYGWYLGVALDANKFGIGLSDTRGWQGEGVGAQVTGGYVLPISQCKAWKLEFNIGLGFYATKYDPYIYDDPYKDSDGLHGEYDPPTHDPNPELHYYYKWYGPADAFKKRQHLFTWLGPTQIGISLKYDLLWKRQQKRGSSFYHTETRKEVRYE